MVIIPHSLYIQVRRVHSYTVKPLDVKTMNTQALLVAIVIVATFGIATITTPVLAQNMTGSENMTATMDDNMTAMDTNMTQPLEDENTTAG